jgi:hypothetical protein
LRSIFTLPETREDGTKQKDYNPRCNSMKAGLRGGALVSG